MFYYKVLLGLVDEVFNEKFGENNLFTLVSVFTIYCTVRSYVLYTLPFLKRLN